MRFLLIVFFFCLGSTTFAFELEHQFQNYDVSDGLPSSQIYQIIEDQRGYIWFGTDRGVVRYNGYEFKTFTVKDGLSIDVVFHLNEGINGEIWCYGKDKKTHCFKGERFYEFRYNDSIKKYTSVESNLLKMDFSDKGFFYNTADNGPGVVVRGRVGLNNKVEKNKTKGVQIFDDEFGPSISLKDKDTTYQIRINNELVNLPSPIYSGNQFATIVRFDSIYFFSIEKHLYQYDLKNDQGIKLIDEFPERIHDMQIDENGNIFLALKFQGLWKLDAKNYENKECLIKDASISSILLDGNGGIWAGSLFKGVFYCENQNNKKLAHKGGNMVIDLQEIQGRIFFISTNDIIYELKDQCEEVIPKATNSIWDIDWNADNFIGFTSTLGQYGYIVDLSNSSFHPAIINRGFVKTKTTSYGIGSSIISEHARVKNGYNVYSSNQFFNCAIPNPDCDLILGTDEGVKEFEHNNAIFVKSEFLEGSHSDQYEMVLTNYLPDQAFFREKMRDMFNSGDSLFIFGSAERGVYIQQQGKKDRWLKEENGLISDAVDKVYFKDGYLVVITNKGLSVINESDGIVNYSARNGLISNDINDVIIRNDTLWTATVKGTSIFSLKKRANSPIPIIFTGFKVNGEKRPIKENYILKYDEKTVDISFEGLSFIQEGDIVYKYQLKGVDQNWVSSSNRTVRYANLPAGDYVFWITAQHTNKKWTTPICLLKFSREKPFWEEIFFLIAVFFMAYGFFWIVIYTRFKRKQKIQQEELLILNMERKTLQAQMNPHFVFNSLTSLQSLILDDKKFESQEYLGKFAFLTRLALNHSTKNTVTLNEEIELLTHYIELERIRFSEKFDYKIEVNSVPLTTNMAPMLIQPFVENAILHGLAAKKEGGLLRIVYEEKDQESFYCTITDNGAGRKENKSNLGQKSLGIKLVSDRLGIISSNTNEKKIEIFDLKDGDQSIGTKVVLILPLNLKK